MSPPWGLQRTHFPNHHNYHKIKCDREKHLCQQAQPTHHTHRVYPHTAQTHVALSPYLHYIFAQRRN